jgi:protein required for attachment to host cells
VNKTWIVVADSARARIFRQDKPRGPLKEQQDLVHPASTVHSRDLTSDRQGRTFDSSHQGGRHAMEPNKDPQEVEIEVFARQLATLLDSARSRGDLDDLVLIAPPRFLGLLTGCVDDQTKKAISKRIHKNLVRHSTDEISAQILRSP